LSARRLRGSFASQMIVEDRSIVEGAEQQGCSPAVYRMAPRASGTVAAGSMHDEVTGSSKPRPGASVVRFLKIVAALITASVAFVVIVVAVLMVVLWVTLGAT